MKAARRSKGLTQIELAKKVGIAVNSLRLYESDARSPQINTVQKIAAALGVSVDTLIGETVYIDTAETISALLNSGEATADNLVERVKERMPGLPEAELLRVEQYAQELRQSENNPRHTQAMNTLLNLPEKQREAVYTIIEAMNGEEEQS